MASEDADMRLDAEATHRDADADEREWLADERERLADERERLADERERLADQAERAADRSGVAMDAMAELATEQLARSEARVQRALAEHERARAAVERSAVTSERADAAAALVQAARAASGLDGDELEWARERRAFVSGERDVLADVRDIRADDRERLADEREREADDRDRAARRREEILAQHNADAVGSAAGLAQPTERARHELAVVRDAARRQRAVATEGRRSAAVERADIRRRRAATSTDPDARSRLTAQFTALTQELFVSQELFAVAEHIAHLTLECIPGAVSSGVTLFEGVRPIAQVTTDDIAEQLDAYQLAQHDGPIAASLESGEPVAVGALSDDSRWPAFRAVADELRVAGVAACGLTVRRGQDWQSLGALTVYAEDPNAFDDDIGEDVALFAAHLAIVAAFDRDRHDVSRREAALHRALGSRDVIGQAKGILMERRRIPAGEAFDILRRTSQRLNVRLQEVAARLAETGELSE